VKKKSLIQELKPLCLGLGILLALNGCKVENGNREPVSRSVTLQLSDANGAKRSQTESAGVASAYVMAIKATDSPFTGGLPATFYDRAVLDASSDTVTLNLPLETPLLLVELGFPGQLNLKEMLATNPITTANSGEVTLGADQAELSVTLARLPVPKITGHSHQSSGSSTTSPISLYFNTPVGTEAVPFLTADGACSGWVQLSADSFVTCLALSSVQRSEETSFLLVQPKAELSRGVTYSLKVTPGLAAENGNRMLEEYSTTFTLPEYSISGFVKDATNNHAIEAATVTVGNKTTSTDSTGFFTLPVGNGQQTLSVAKTGYDGFTQTYTLSGADLSVGTIGLSPALAAGQYRFVLSWGATPSDLDFHLLLPDKTTVYYGNRTSNGSNLNVDVTGGFGPETITITSQVSGTYKLVVHNFSGTGSFLGASVKVYDSTGLKGTYSAGDSTQRYWHVLNLSGSTLTSVMSYQASPAAP